MSLNDLIKKYKPLVDAEIEGELERRLEEVKDISLELVKIVEAMRELSVGGKRLRALLVILGYELTGAKTAPLQDIVKAGMVMELFHLGLLIQDDVMDRDNLRRGVTTIHSRYSDLHLGEAVAMCAGDFTFGWGMEILSNQESVISNQSRLGAMQVWGKYFYRVGYGQVLDVMKTADEGKLLQILALKSGEYSCVLPLLLGATLGGASEELKEQLTKYGMELGWVFQLRDDWLGEYGDSGKTGKPVGNDSREGKKTLATMYGKERLEKEIKKHMELAAESLQGLTLKVDVLTELVEWVGTRES